MHEKTCPWICIVVWKQEFQKYEIKYQYPTLWFCYESYHWSATKLKSRCFSGQCLVKTKTVKFCEKFTSRIIRKSTEVTCPFAVLFVSINSVLDNSPNKFEGSELRRGISFPNLCHHHIRLHRSFWTEMLWKNGDIVIPATAEHTTNQMAR